MNAKPQSHAKMVDSARTHMEAINAYANLDLREKLRNRWVINHRGLESIPLAAGLVDFRPNLTVIIIIIIIKIMMMIIYFYSDYYQ